MLFLNVLRLSDDTNTLNIKLQIYLTKYYSDIYLLKLVYLIDSKKLNL